MISPPGSGAWVEVLVAGIVSTLATGLGAIPLFILPRKSQAKTGILYAIAGGFMMSASVFSIAAEGLHIGSTWEVLAGFILGGLFLTWAATFFPEHSDEAGDNHKRSTLVLLALFVHSIPEGIAIGVGFATGQTAFGLIMATAISVHNIPEGTAMSLPLRDEGAGFWKCFWYSVLTSLPQAIFALPAFLLVNWVRSLVPLTLAFAGGAMIYLVIFDLLPQAFESSSSRRTVAWGFLLGLTAMMLVTVWIERFSLSG